LIISSPISSAGGNVSINGGGSVVLSGASTFTNGVSLNSSTIIFGASSTPTSGTVTSGPIGTGALNLNTGSTIFSSNNFTIANTVNVGGSFAFGGTGAANNLTLSGSVLLGGSSPTMTVTSPFVTGTISGPISSTALPGTTAFTKAGPGTLLISNSANSLGGGKVVVASGVLNLGSPTAIEAAGATGTAASNVQVNAGAVFNVNGNSAGIGSLAGDSLTTGGMVTDSGAAATLTIGNDNTNQTFAGVITNSTNALGLTKVGTGTQTLSGVNTYTGATNVNQGKVIVSGSLAGTTSTTVASGATLASGAGFATTGTINYIHGSVTANSDTNGGGTIAPGDTGGSGTSTVGQLSINGNLALGTTTGLGNGPAHLSMELGGTTAGTQYDQVLVTASSTVSLANVNLDVSLINSFIPFSGTITGGTQNLDGNAFYLVVGSGTSVTGTFANVTGSDPNLPLYSTFFVGSQEFAVSYSANYNNGSNSQFAQGSGNDIAIMAIPEPNSMSMLAGSLGLALGLQRFRRRRSRA
jgi:autotransporter-associated beta strand protein